MSREPTMRRGAREANEELRHRESCASVDRTKDPTREEILSAVDQYSANLDAANKAWNDAVRAEDLRHWSALEVIDDAFTDASASARRALRDVLGRRAKS